MHRAIFRDPEGMRSELDSLQRRLTPELFAALLSLLSEVPDADQALRLLEKLISSAGADCLSPSSSGHSALRHALLLFGHSYWLGEALVQHPDLLSAVKTGKDLQGAFAHEDFRARLAHFRAREKETDISLLLARF